MSTTKILCNNCRQPFHGQTACDEAASPRIKALMAKSKAILDLLAEVEQELYDLDYQHYEYRTGSRIRRTKGQA